MFSYIIKIGMSLMVVFSCLIWNTYNYDSWTLILVDRECEWRSHVQLRRSMEPGFKVTATMRINLVHGPTPHYYHITYLVSYCHYPRASWPTTFHPNSNSKYPWHMLQVFTFFFASQGRWILNVTFYFILWNTTACKSKNELKLKL